MPVRPAGPTENSPGREPRVKCCRLEHQNKLTFDNLFATSKRLGYTFGMKTAVSIPDDIFNGAERLARRTKKSRSRLFSEAMQEYLMRHAADEVTEAMNRACTELGESQDPFVALAARRILERSEW